MGAEKYAREFEFAGGSIMDEEMLPDLIGESHKAMLVSDTSGLSCNAEQFWLLAMGSLEQAKRFATLALYAQRQARVT